MSWFVQGHQSDQCYKLLPCREVIQKVLTELSTTIEVGYALDPPESLLLCDHFDALCYHCRKDATAVHLAGRQEIFDALPSFFGLEPWDQLKDDA